MHGSWLSSFHFTILASHRSSDGDFRSLEVRLRPAVLLSQELADYHAYTNSTWPDTSVLVELAADTSRTFRSRRLGHFPSERNEFVYRIFENYDSNPCGRVIDILWWVIIWHIDDVRLSLRSATITGHPGAEFLHIGFSRMSTDFREVWATRCVISFCPSLVTSLVPISAISLTFPENLIS